MIRDNIIQISLNESFINFVSVYTFKQSEFLTEAF